MSVLLSRAMDTSLSPPRATEATRSGRSFTARTRGRYTSLEICAGMGGQALGLERAGFEHLALVELEEICCRTLRENRPRWNVIAADVKTFSAAHLCGKVDLLAGGVPCPPFSVAGKQLGGDDDRDLFPEALRIARECEPKAIMLENVKGFLDPKFALYREALEAQLNAMDYVLHWKLHRSSDYGVPQLRPRVVLVALRPRFAAHFEWPQVARRRIRTVGAALRTEMAANGWEGAEAWAAQAQAVAPTLVGGSKKHGGADLGPVRARESWAKLGINGKSLAELPPEPGFQGMPRLTVKMAALVQGFPVSWQVVGKKTEAYRQVGNAFPPPVAEAVGLSITAALVAGDTAVSA